MTADDFAELYPTDDEFDALLQLFRAALKRNAPDRQAAAGFLLSWRRRGLGGAFSPPPSSAEVAEAIAAVQAMAERTKCAASDLGQGKPFEHVEEATAAWA